MHFVSAMDSVSGIRAVLGLHETVCSGAADGYGRMARIPAMTLLHLGPGLANGLCNFHNARRAGTPIVSLVGEMATWHKSADPLLNMDIESIAGAVSGHVRTCRSGDDLYAAMAEACLVARKPRAINGSAISTLIVPHDLSWQREEKREVNGSYSLGSLQSKDEDSVQTEMVQQFVKDCAEALTDPRKKGKVAIYAGGAATIQDEDALLYLGKIASKIGAPIYCENAFSRLDRGAGLVNLQRLPYFPDDALETLNRFGTLLVIDVRRPVANFGYEDGPSQVMVHSDDDIWEIDSEDMHVPSVLRSLCTAIGADDITPLVNCGGVFCPPRTHRMPSGRLTADKMCQVVAILQPDSCVIVDESLTSGNSYWNLSQGCPPFSHLALTGGAIGCGPPLSVGAAIACPGRRVINLQADGSGMYSVQALWTQARENLNVITIICANRSYQILKVELAKQQIVPSNGPCARALTDIGKPNLKWTDIGEGMGVRSTRATTAEELAEQLRAALAREGPSLIEAWL